MMIHIPKALPDPMTTGMLSGLAESRQEVSSSPMEMMLLSA